MWFLIKSAFWFTVVLMLLPLADPATQATSGRQPQVRIGATVEAATSALDDLTGICKRRPDVCKTGGETLAALGARARDGALVAYQFLDGRFGGSRSENVITGTVAPGNGAATQEPDALASVDVAATAVPVPMPAPRLAATASTAMAGQVYLPRPYSPPVR